MRLLPIDCGPRREPHGRGLPAATVARLVEVAPGAGIRRRDLGASPLAGAVQAAAGEKAIAAIDLAAREERRIGPWPKARPHLHLAALAGA